MLRIAIASVAWIALACGMASADTAAQQLAVKHLEAGTLAAGDAELGAIVAADPNNADARMGLGVIRFVRAVEHLSQGLYRYGLKPPQSFLVHVVRLPVPPNPSPESITYEDFRGLLQTFVTDIASAEETLAGIGAADPHLPLDLARIRYDVNGDNTVTADELFVAVIGTVTGMRADDMPASLAFNFDRADALWLRGYSNVLMAFGEFLLAYDWHESFDTTFHNFFPRSNSPYAAALATGSGGMYDEAAPIADFISFIHIRWPVLEPARMAAARQHLKAMTALSRETFKAIDAETDNDREWLPNARQTGPFESVVVDAARITVWFEVLDEVDAVLDGTKLVPHWRFREGFNLRKVFDEPRPFDLVLWIAGPAAFPYLKAGPTSTSEEWARMIDAFGDSFGLFALWAN